MRAWLDKKTGTPMAWSRIQTAAYTLLEESDELMFDEGSHIYKFRGQVLPSVTGLLKAEGYIDTTFYNDAGRTRGSYVHLATHLDDQGELDEDTLDPGLVGYVESWRRFKAESGFVVEISEVPMVNPSLGYCGTPDVIGNFPSGSLTRGVVELRPNGTYQLIPHRDRTDVDIWRCIMASYNWKQANLKKGAR